MKIKRLILPLIAALALPTSVNAESYWLILIQVSTGKGFEKIEMESMEQCEEQGKIFLGYIVRNSWYLCLTGK